MKHKKLVILLAVYIAIIIPTAVFAATSDMPAAKAVRGFFGIDTSNLTDEQQADVENYKNEIKELHQDFINKMVDNGGLTREQGDAALEKIQEGPWQGVGPGLMHGKGGGGPRARKGPASTPRLDLSKLTEEQKAEFIEISQKMNELILNHIDKMVETALITTQQADAIKAGITEAAEKIGDENIMLHLHGPLGMRTFGLPGGKGLNINLTEEQKAEASEFQSNMDELRKELIEKMAANGLITGDQSERLINRVNE